MNSQNITLREYLTQTLEALTPKPSDNAEEIFRYLEDKLTMMIRDDKDELLPNTSFSVTTPHPTVRHLTLNFFDRMYFDGQFALVGYFFDPTGKNWNGYYDCKDRKFHFTESSTFLSSVPLVSEERVVVCTNFTEAMSKRQASPTFNLKVLACEPIFLDPIKKSPVRFIHPDTTAEEKQNTQPLPLAYWVKNPSNAGGNPSNQGGMWAFDENSPT